MRSSNSHQKDRAKFQFTPKGQGAKRFLKEKTKWFNFPRSLDTALGLFQLQPQDIGQAVGSAKSTLAQLSSSGVA